MFCTLHRNDGNDQHHKMENFELKWMIKNIPYSSQLYDRFREHLFELLNEHLFLGLLFFGRCFFWSYETDNLFIWFFLLFLRFNNFEGLDIPHFGDSVNAFYAAMMKK